VPAYDGPAECQPQTGPRRLTAMQSGLVRSRRVGSLKKNVRGASKQRSFFGRIGRRV
jgi:hypothetical protein